MSQEPWKQQTIDASVADDIVDLLMSQVSTSNLLSVRNLWMKDEATHKHRRVEFIFRIGKNLLSRFMNDRSGYRGHYFDGPKIGDDFNKSILTRLSETLLEQYGSSEVGGDDDCDEMSNDEFLISLPAGKLWLVNEFKKDPIITSCAEWATIEWDSNVKKYKAMLVETGRFNDVDAEEHYKLCVDKGKRVEDRLGPFELGRDGLLSIAGAFVRGASVETVDCKRDRALQIHCFGAS